jgi:threonine dehydrogenase-like Zn-dependent dehydrogenase
MHSSVKTDHASEPLNVGDRVYWTGIRPCGKCYYWTVIDDECGCPDNFFMHVFEDVEKLQGTWATYTEITTLGPRNAFFKVDKGVPREAFIAPGCALPTVLQAVGHLQGKAIQVNENIVYRVRERLGWRRLCWQSWPGRGSWLCLRRMR